MSEAVLVRGAEAEVLTRDPGSLITLLADTTDTGGLLTTNRSLLRAGSAGAPVHFHEHSHELFFVLGGELDVLLDQEIITLRGGDLLIVPPKLPHAFAPTAGADADMLVLFTPGRPRFDYYRLLDRFHAGEAPGSEIGASQEQFDNHYVESALWAERMRRASA